jgi:hypothetical protein
MSSVTVTQAIQPGILGSILVILRDFHLAHGVRIKHTHVSPIYPTQYVYYYYYYYYYYYGSTTLSWTLAAFSVS